MWPTKLRARHGKPRILPLPPILSILPGIVARNLMYVGVLYSKRLNPAELSRQSVKQNTSEAVPATPHLPTRGTNPVFLLLTIMHILLVKCISRASFQMPNLPPASRAVRFLFLGSRIYRQPWHPRRFYSRTSHHDEPRDRFDKHHCPNTCVDDRNVTIHATNILPPITVIISRPDISDLRVHHRALFFFSIRPRS